MNITKILQQKPIKCNLWSPLVGECYFDRILPNNRINVRFLDCDGYYKEISFSEDGRYFDSGECLLFPSEEMKDWDKYTWKKYDSLTNNNKIVIFDQFYNNNYIRFLDKEGNIHKTEDFHKSHIFKPYDKVLVRDEDFQTWNANLFSHYSNIHSYPCLCLQYV